MGAIADKYGPRYQLLMRQMLWLVRPEKVEQDYDEDEDDHHLN
jgi:hypothetical protein